MYFNLAEIGWSLRVLALLTPHLHVPCSEVHALKKGNLRFSLAECGCLQRVLPLLLSHLGLRYRQLGYNYVLCDDDDLLG